MTPEGPLFTAAILIYAMLLGKSWKVAPSKQNLWITVVNIIHPVSISRCTKQPLFHLLSGVTSGSVAVNQKGHL